MGLKPGASSQEIKRAFKELAFKYHPDRNPKNPWAEERFKEALEAYSYLTGNMEAYRAMTSKTAAATVAADPGADILKVLFDIDVMPTSRHKKPLVYPLNLTLEEAFTGGEKKIRVTRDELCETCGGRGVDEGAKVFTCTYCFGAGYVGGASASQEESECPKCNGRGILSSRGCTACRARGFLSREAKLRVTIPPRVTHGQQVAVPSEGHHRHAGRRDDLLLQISLAKHPVFSFDGKDIICESTVDMTDAALGGEISVPTLRGPTKLTLPPGTQSGQVFRLKGLGLGGDQFVKIQVRTPTALSEKERKSLLSLKRVDGSEQRGLLARLKRWFW
jgi:molecular chaperone DnaJ